MSEPSWRDDLDNLLACAGEAQWVEETDERLTALIEGLESRLDSLRQNLAVAYSILNDAMAEQDYHVDVSRTAVWLASNEGAVERQIPGTDENWDNRTLGADERHVRVATGVDEAAIDRALKKGPE